MPAPQWKSFAGVTLLVLAMLVALARASQSSLSAPELRDGDSPGGTGAPAREAGTVAGEPPTSDDEAGDDRPTGNGETGREATGDRDATARETLTPELLLVNVAVSQGLFGAVLVAAAWIGSVPPGALGVGTVTLRTLALGVAIGVALFAANELGQHVADALGIDYAEGMRELLTPDSARGWFVLLFLVLPIIAGFEELLFRGALIGAFAAGFGVSPWLLAAGSTVAFALGHGAQGPGGILVTGLLGGALAAVFVLTESLPVVVVAHYLVNALEFTVHARD
ncbi:lysostaphin resistance A-like protein [Halomicrococcus sp. SG-WS-1]|uniref:CPBP family intramembrane glutamic endopeptidase n=1 Tax=Halomicrococcus sp. SG-WS-1 TaxID=3439057 RepID=UPI003F7ADF48